MVEKMVLIEWSERGGMWMILKWRSNRGVIECRPPPFIMKEYEIE